MVTPSLYPPRLIRPRRWRWRYHQAQTLQKHHCPLRRGAPDELATLTLTVLHVDVTAGILQTAILERAVDKHPVVKHQVLVFEDFVFVSSHQKTRLPLPGGDRKLSLKCRGGRRSFPPRRESRLRKTRPRDWTTGFPLRGNDEPMVGQSTDQLAVTARHVSIPLTPDRRCDSKLTCCRSRRLNCQAANPEGRTIATATFLRGEREARTRALSFCRASA